LTLTFAASPKRVQAHRRIALALVESSAIMSAGAALAWGMGASFISVAGFLALLYYPVRDIAKPGRFLLAPSNDGNWRRESRTGALRRLRTLIATAYPVPTDRSRDEPTTAARGETSLAAFAKSAAVRAGLLKQRIRPFTSSQRVGRSIWRRISRRAPQDGRPTAVPPSAATDAEQAARLRGPRD
jgi:hypothetical protein